MINAALQLKQKGRATPKDDAAKSREVQAVPGLRGSYRAFIATMMMKAVSAMTVP